MVALRAASLRCATELCLRCQQDWNTASPGVLEERQDAAAAERPEYTKTLQPPTSAALHWLPNLVYRHGKGTEFHARSRGTAKLPQPRNSKRGLP